MKVTLKNAFSKPYYRSAVTLIGGEIIPLLEYLNGRDKETGKITD